MRARARAPPVHTHSPRWHRATSLLRAGWVGAQAVGWKKRRDFKSDEAYGAYVKKQLVPREGLALRAFQGDRSGQSGTCAGL